MEDDWRSFFYNLDNFIYSLLNADCALWDTFGIFFVFNNISSLIRGPPNRLIKSQMIGGKDD